MNIGFVTNLHNPDAAALFDELAGQLREEGHAIRSPESNVGPTDFSADVDLVVVLGGDGTVLRAVELTQGRRVPLLAINLGHLGYLAEVEAKGAREAVHRFIEGRYRIESRMTVVGRVQPGGREFEGLNEIVVTGGAVGRLAEISCAIDAEEFTVYRCDALLVSTPTGSTAYALSAGGPIVSPGLDCLVLVPVAAHNLFNSAIVLRPDEGLILRSNGEQPAAISVDGRHAGELHRGEELHLGTGTEGVPFVRMSGLDFLARLREKFGLTVPGRGSRPRG